MNFKKKILKHILKEKLLLPHNDDNVQVSEPTGDATCTTVRNIIFMHFFTAIPLKMRTFAA